MIVFHGSPYLRLVSSHSRGDTSVQCCEAAAEILALARSIHQTVLCCCSLYAHEYVLLKELADILILCNQCNYKLINNCNVYVLWGCVQFYVQDM